MSKWFAARSPIRVLLTCALLLAFLLPSIDTCICAADLDPNGPSGISYDIASVGIHGVTKQSNPADTKGAPCQFCHCYHWVGVAKVERPTFGATAMTMSAWHRVDGSAPAAPVFSLLRPPRA